jgi:hypothetical protein
MAEKKAWRALRGLNWSEGETEYRAEAGDKIEDLPENVIKHERAAGNIEEWVDRQTENVYDPDADEDVKMFGVMEVDGEMRVIE